VSVWQPVYIGVGSNVDDPIAQVRRALSKLAALAATRVICVSPLYGSRPFGPVAQPDFVNAVAGALTQLDSRKLLAELQARKEPRATREPREMGAARDRP